MEENKVKRKRRFGDRRDGRKLRSLDPMSRVAVYIMPDRNGANNLFADKVEVTEMEHYIRRKRREGLSGFGIMHVFIAAYVRVVSQRPGINRFLSGQTVYQRDDTIEICLAVKKTMELNASETVVKMTFAPTDTPEIVYKKIAATVAENKEAPLDSDFDKVAAGLNKIPGVLFKFAIWFLKLMDYFDLVPKSLLEVSPFHGSMFITSMGSLGIPPIFHHLYDFGNVPVFMSFGAKRKEYELKADGNTIERKYVDYTVVCDERICDGFYYASALKVMKSLLKNPFQLDTPIEGVIRDID